MDVYLYVKLVQGNRTILEFKNIRSIEYAVGVMVGLLSATHLYQALNGDKGLKVMSKTLFGPEEIQFVSFDQVGENVILFKNAYTNNMAKFALNPGNIMGIWILSPESFQQQVASLFGINNFDFYEGLRDAIKQLNLHGYPISLEDVVVGPLYDPAGIEYVKK